MSRTTPDVTGIETIDFSNEVDDPMAAYTGEMPVHSSFALSRLTLVRLCPSNIPRMEPKLPPALRTVASTYFYDLKADRRIVGGHGCDFNAVSYADHYSPHLLYSGSDDTTVKVWDKRSIAKASPVGVLPGHTKALSFWMPRRTEDIFYPMARIKK